MELAAQYARALWDAKNPDTKRVHEALKRRGHLKLLPKIYAELQKLHIGKERAAMYRTTTPHMQQTKVLLELYRKLTAN